MAEKSPPKEPEFDPDAWERFERAVDAGLHTKPVHKEAKPKEGRGPKPAPKE